MPTRDRHDECRAGRDGGRLIWSGAAAGVFAALALAINPWTVAALLSPDGSIENRGLLAIVVAVPFLLCLATIGVLLRRPRLRGSDLLAIAVSGAFVVLGLEVAMRVAYRQDDLWFTTMRHSETLGWETRPHFTVERAMGAYGVVRFTTSTDGFRRFGRLDSSRPRVLILGDSFTEAAQVSDGGTYYDYLADRAGLDIEVFAYGASAYGSLQEYLVLDRVIDDVRPHLILWQFCSNDLLNNYRPLEAQSLYENSWWRRPYLEDGEIVVRAPSLRWLSQISRVAMFLESRRAIVRAQRLKSGDSSEVVSIESELSPAHPLYGESVAVTTEIMRRVRARASDVPVVAFGVNRPAWLGTAFERIAEASDIAFIDRVPEMIEARKRAGHVVDGVTNQHWNATAHGFAGAMIADSLVAWGLLERARADGRRPIIAGTERE